MRTGSALTQVIPQFYAPCLNRSEWRRKEESPWSDRLSPKIPVSAKGSVLS